MKLTSFLLTLGVGAVAGVLLAPKKGEDTLEDLKNKGQEAYDKVKGMSKEDLTNKLNGTIDNVKKSIDEFDMDSFKATTQAKVDELSAKLDELKNKVQNTDQYAKVADGVDDVTKKVNDKIDDLKQAVKDTGVLPDADEIESEIEDVENELDGIIDEIND